MAFLLSLHLKIELLMFHIKKKQSHVCSKPSCMDILYSVNLMGTKFLLEIGHMHIFFFAYYAGFCQKCLYYAGILGILSLYVGTVATLQVTLQNESLYHGSFNKECAYFIFNSSSRISFNLFLQLYPGVLTKRSTENRGYLEQKKLVKTAGSWCTNEK